MVIQKIILKIKKFDRILFLIFILYTGLRCIYFQYVPLWDGWANSGEVIYDAVSSPFDITKFNVVGHPSFVYLFLISFLQYFSLGSVALIHLSITVLTVFSIYSFYHIAKFFFPQKEKYGEIYALTFLYAFFPLIVSNSFHINTDYGVLLFFIFTLYFLLKKKYKGVLLSGIGLVFSKEVGVGLYGILLSCYYFYFSFIQRFTSIRMLKIAIKKIYLLTPIVLFIIHIASTATSKKGGLWFLTMLSMFSGDFQMPGLSPETAEKIPFSYFLGIFVINFNWILTTFIFVGLIFLMILPFTGKKEVQINSKISSIIFLYALFFSFTFVLTSYKTFTNFRYFLSLYPLMILLAYWGIWTIFRNIQIRRFLVGIIVIIFFFSNFRLFDSLSKKVYGTFLFGKHEILHITSITGECCGYGRDQLVYNLETTHFHYLLNDIVGDIKPDEQTAFAYHPVVGPQYFLNIDKKTYKRTIARNEAFLLNVVNWKYNFLNPKPAVIYYMEFPIEDNKPEIAAYLHDYEIAEIKTYDQDGYTMNVYTLRLKKTI